MGLFAFGWRKRGLARACLIHVLKVGGKVLGYKVEEIIMNSGR